jgi:hypothetical protein
MMEYEVEWSSNMWSKEIRHTIWAEDEDHAYRNAIEKYTYPEYSHIGIFIVGGDTVKGFDNPHHKKLKEESKREGTKGVEESRSEQTVKTDGSVGWYENLGESSLSDRDILLAQLHELQTIKRCVVGTVVIAIVIPVIVGGLISG